MTKPRRPLTANDAGLLIALLAILLGGFVYLYQPWQAGFPINDGGLFYAMIRTVQGNGFRLPVHVAYNGLEIPFVYPPLGFYLAAILSSVLRVDVLSILQWAPAVVLIVIAVCFYYAAREILQSPIEAGIATFLYVFTPRSATWLIMGGGITRSLGQLFLLLTLTSVYRMYKRRTPGAILLTILFGGLVVLSHPEAALHALALSVAFWLILGRSRRTALDSAIVAAGVAFLTSIWWIPLLSQHGLGPTLAAGQTGLHNALAFVYPLFMMFTEEPAMTIVAALGTIGFFVAVAGRQWLLPAWFLLPFFVEPRSAPTVAVLPLAMLAARALHGVVFPAVASAAQPFRTRASDNYIETGAVKVAAVYLEAFVVVMGMYAGMQLARVRVSAGNAEAMGWVHEHTSPQSRFLVLTGGTELFCDPVLEWFPVLTDRVSTTTIQGNEWLGNPRFLTQMARLQQVQLCTEAPDPASCLRERVSVAGIEYDHIYVSRSGPSTRGCRADEQQRTGEALLSSLRANDRYETVYVSDAVEILAVRP